NEADLFHDEGAEMRPKCEAIHIPVAGWFTITRSAPAGRRLTVPEARRAISGTITKRVTVQRGWNCPGCPATRQSGRRPGARSPASWQRRQELSALRRDRA